MADRPPARASRMGRAECPLRCGREVDAQHSAPAIAGLWRSQPGPSAHNVQPAEVNVVGARLASSRTWWQWDDLSPGLALVRQRDRKKRRAWAGICGGSTEGSCRRLDQFFSSRGRIVRRIWRYVLAADNGMAPCLQDGVLSLCCCKPLIRRSARMGDWVIGFLPKRMGLGRVAWAGKIGEIAPLGDYQERFNNRFDAIYRRTGYALDGRELLEPLRVDYHADIKSRSRDRSGQNALIFDPFWYWGREAVTAPEHIADLAHYYVGQSTKHSTSELLVDLERWLYSIASPGAHGRPRDPIATKHMA